MDLIEKLDSTILITGAGGFLGQELAAALLESEPTAYLVLADVVTREKNHHHLSRSCVDKGRHSLLQPTFAAWLKVNLDSFRLILDNLRHNQRGVKVIFSSSLAVYGPSQSGRVTGEKTIPIPQSSYGAEKLIVETLVNDFSRRGLIDGRICRLPTVIVRPGVPSAAASSFASGIDLEMWVASPKNVVKNLVAIKDVPKDKFGAAQGRTVNLPGQTVTVREILE
ncbi:related to nucleoside-diphosphate-sugar epimerases [Phialocephala subalpina]|uniref:Related to nucleoside-diphosphate-sugar epimerases n=1 Tax=Phialocephala subalpina TaxID=576137 RepID=A0A1L7XW96_9HELO|nr:related to nucleoside-diphosphate-sugar epimerases [Phialocephala subalpina]